MANNHQKRAGKRECGGCSRVHRASTPELPDPEEEPEGQGAGVTTCISGDNITAQSVGADVSSKYIRYHQSPGDDTSAQQSQFHQLVGGDHVTGRYEREQETPNRFAERRPVERHASTGLLYRSRQKDNRISVLRSEVHAYQLKLQQAQDDILRLENEYEQLEDDFRKIQEHAFRQFDSPDWKPESDDDVTRKLNLLDSDVKKWSKAHCIPCLSIEDSKQYQVLRKIVTNSLADFAKPNDEGLLARLPSDKPWVLVQAFLMDKIYSDVFDKPFFGLSAPRMDWRKIDQDTEEPEDPQVKKNLGKRDPAQLLEALYDEFSDCNIEDAVSWRVQTLRQLCPPVRDGETKERKKRATRDRTLKSREQAVGSLTLWLLNSDIRVLLKAPDDEGAKADLHTLVAKAADLSYTLRTQKNNLGTKGFNDMEHRFAHNNPLMEAHQLHNKHLDEDPTVLDGRSILVITHPALVRKGNEYGTDFGTRVVLKKAVCWMGALPEEK
ncbi:hypothetical protein P153DRAFT_395444 [Dothidotthia symphoricarpi CBS 119687]|uniref:Uncharacterized protein n=1 Tax=Dothidotthia symphoricarpi CBS 119687 TaxID=1392245 RepID=A0A6A6AGD5_9PLEO|nr:uncharacterized protein P153DRAFT_395444 [Dothidotthia symphoricarpi CBS 119687]KAF2131052.1 hypothetical protein P153DRAFT_395444 [Dothidotthia symphoricarpi CBS 119687]